MKPTTMRFQRRFSANEAAFSKTRCVQTRHCKERCFCFNPNVPKQDAYEPRPFEINGSSVFWPDLDADIGAEGLLAGAGEHPYYARKSVERAVRMGRLPASALESRAPASLRSA